MAHKIGNLKLVKYITCQLVFVFLALIIPMNTRGAPVYVVSALSPCVLTQNHSYTGDTLNMEFNLGTETPATWNVYLSVFDVVIPLWSAPLPAIDPPIAIPVAIPGFPSFKTIGFLTTLTTADGIICSHWDTVDTTYKLSDTGQTQDFTPTFGEDSDYTINPPSFTDNSDGTVTDNNTCLMWQQLNDELEKWDSAISYCESLVLAGHFDWRLPDIKELGDIVDLGKYDPAIDETYFPDIHSSYWSSTTSARDPGFAWDVFSGTGAVGPDMKSNLGWLRCVRD